MLTDDAKKWKDEKARKEAEKKAEVEAKMQVLLGLFLAPAVPRDATAQHVRDPKRAARQPLCSRPLQQLRTACSAALIRRQFDTQGALAPYLPQPAPCPHNPP